jgi:nucleoside 2-deoxyribosyltransferase
VKLIYVAGPYRGKTAWEVAQNIRKAEEWGFLVVQAGHMPVIPHANCAHFDGEGEAQFWLDGTLEMMRRCDAVLVFATEAHGRVSSGTLGEIAEAERLGLPMYRAEGPTWARVADAVRWLESLA